MENPIKEMMWQAKWRCYDYVTFKVSLGKADFITQQKPPSSIKTKFFLSNFVILPLMP